jgi:hypothetical protein
LNGARETAVETAYRQHTVSPPKTTVLDRLPPMMTDQASPMCSMGSEEPSVETRKMTNKKGPQPTMTVN